MAPSMSLSSGWLLGHYYSASDITGISDIIVHPILQEYPVSGILQDSKWRVGIQKIRKHIVIKVCQRVPFE